MAKVLQKIVRFSLVVVGILSAGLGLKGFLLPNHFIDGGVTGTSMLVSQISGISLAFLILCINTPFVFLGWRQIGWKFSLRSAVAIIGLSASILIIPYPSVTDEPLLGAVFGGFFLGTGIGFAIRGGAVLDGTEVVALLVSRKTGITIGDFIFIFNVVLFSVAAFFLGIESALYSMLTYFSASKTVDFFVEGLEEYNAMMIVSKESEKIREAIIKDLERGVTVFAGRGGKNEETRDILLCVVTRFEIPKIKETVQEFDENAFITVHQISETSGGIIKSSFSPILQAVDLHEEIDNSKILNRKEDESNRDN